MRKINYVAFRQLLAIGATLRTQADAIDQLVEELRQKKPKINPTPEEWAELLADIPEPTPEQL